MDYKKFLEDNKPILSCEIMPIFKNICKTKKCFNILVGIALVTIISTAFYLTFQNNKSPNKILLSRESTLNSELSKMENINEVLEAEILLLQDDVKSLYLKKDKKTIHKIEKYLADTEIKGSGVTISVYDNNSPDAPVQDESTVVHNTDLLKIINFLWAEGAVAISINGERIGINSHISCVGPTILVNQKRINSPFYIQAIGEKLDKNRIKNEAFVLSFKLRGIEFKIDENNDILVPAGQYTTITE